MSGLITCTLAPASTLMVTAGFCARAGSAAIRNNTTYPHTILGRDMQSLLTVRRVHLSSSPLALYCKPCYGTNLCNDAHKSWTWYCPTPVAARRPPTAARCFVVESATNRGDC